MYRQGPLLQSLLHRLGECPAEFLLPHQTASPGTPARAGTVDILAIVCDHFHDMDANPREGDHVIRLRAAIEKSGRLAGLIAVATWLLHDEVFLKQPDLAPAMWNLLETGLTSLAELVEPQTFITDADRREELVRICLAGLELLPRGETMEQAADRLSSLDSVERERVVSRTQEAEARARKVREMMAKRAAEEAAAKPTRE